jgi:hypothetical protein
VPRDAFRLLLDTPQRRIRDDLIALTAGFSDWREAFSENIWLEPVTRTAILAPTPKHPEWRSSGSGIYRRLRKGDYWIGSATGHTGDPAKWYENDRGVVKGDWMIHNTDANDVLYTVRPYPANQGWMLSYYAFNVGNDRWIQIEFGWGDQGTVAGAVSCRVWSDGEVEVWKDGRRVGTGSLGGLESGGSDQTSGACVDLLLLPWRRRELLISTNQGGGFSQVFLDLDDDADGQIILPAAQFWWRIPEGAVAVQLHPVSYRESGQVTSRKYRMRAAPGAGRASTIRPIGFPGAFPFAGALRNANNSGAFVANGTAVEARVRVELAGDGFAMPFLNGACAMFPATFVNTPDETLDITAQCTDGPIKITIPDDVEGVRVAVTIRDENGYDDYKFGTNRAARLMYGDLVCMELRSEPPKLNIQHKSLERSNPVEMEFRDIWAGLERITFSDDVPFDQWSAADAFRFLFSFVVDPSLCVIDASLETFLIEPTDGREDFGTIAKVGDSAAKWIRRLHEDYCGDMFLGFKPTALGYVPHVLKLDRYRSADHTVWMETSEVGTPPADFDPVELVIRSYEETQLNPEANIVFVTGWDPAAKAPIFVSMEDQRSTDPTIARAERPINHMGEPVKYGLVDPSLTRLKLVEDVCKAIYNRITWPRWLVNCRLIPQIVQATNLPLWRGDALLIDTRGTFEVRSQEMELVIEKSTMVRRRGSLEAEYLWD